MSNYLGKNEEATPQAVPPRNRRRLWLATGAAGLAGVVGLGAIGGAAVAGTPSLAALNWANAQSILTGDGTSPEGGHKDDKGHKGKGHEGKGHDGKGDWRGQNGQGQNGRSQNGQGQNTQGQNGRGQNAQGQNTQGQQATAVPCNRDALFAAINQANARQGGTLRLAAECTYELRAATGANALPPITSRITILGERSIIERAYSSTNAGTSLFRFFEVANGGHLTLRDVTLRNGMVSGAERGGAIAVRAGGEAVIENSTLTGNSALGATGTGGAVENAGITTLRNTKLALNNAASGGGALRSTGVLVVEKSLFEANKSVAPVTTSANHGGGAIESTGTATIRDTRFLGNESGGNGGALHTRGGAADIANSQFTANTAAASGGAIANEGGTQLRLREVTLLENTAAAVAGANRGGGGIFNGTESTVTALSGVQLTGNSASLGVGGGVSNLGDLAMSGGVFTGNQAGTTGGGIHNGATGEVTLLGTNVTLNQARIAGGGIHHLAAAGAATIDLQSRVTGNNSTNCAGRAIPNCQG
ncbi:hypothetical protein [Micromonospora echinospora]|uniref:hypothetical protein n=1 Tax=Micromonospora echinospora TaxID=1877 RepID=UPI003A8483C5